MKGIACNSVALAKDCQNCVKINLTSSLILGRMNERGDRIEQDEQIDTFLSSLFNRTDLSKWVDPSTRGEYSDEDSFTVLQNDYIGIPNGDCMRVQSIGAFIYQMTARSGALILDRNDVEKLNDARDYILKRYRMNPLRQSLTDLAEPAPGLGV